MSSVNKHIVLASGGTGGHVFPARALASELMDRGYEITLMTDNRGTAYEKLFPGATILPVRSGSPSVGGVLSKVKAVLNIGLGCLDAAVKLKKLKPAAVIGFGGYPSMPPVFSASILGIPVLLHEQNSVLGRVNKFLASRATAIATSFLHTEGGDRAVLAKMKFTGNPVRPEILALKGSGYHCPEASEKINLLIIGGSQGATVLSDVVPSAIKELPEELQSRLHITQQCRPEDLDRVTEKYGQTSATTDLATFFDNMPELLEKCHLAIVRSGASTMAELAVVGRPSILVPYKFAMDDHQTKNAMSAVDRGASDMITQDDFTVPVLTKKLTCMLEHPEKLKTMANAMAHCAESSAVVKLADLVEKHLHSKKTQTPLKGKVVA